MFHDRRVCLMFWAGHRAKGTPVGCGGIPPERNGRPTGTPSGKRCILGQEMKFQEVLFRAG